MTIHPDLLPGEQYIAELLGLTDAQMLEFKTGRELAAARWRAEREASGIPLIVNEPISTGTAISLAVSALSVGFSVVSSLLRPKPPRSPGQVSVRADKGVEISEVSRFSPRPGFESTQEPLRHGSVVPITFARREYLPASGIRPAGYYGGIRISPGLVLSRMHSLGDSMMWQGLFIAGMAPMAEVDPTAFAFGNNPLRSYDLGSDAANQAASRVTVYWRPNSGRIVSADRIAGTSAANDVTNAENQGALDVFQSPSIGGAFAADSCSTGRPSSSSALGNWGFIPNGMAFRPNPALISTTEWFMKPKGDNGNQVADPEDDLQALATVWKQVYHWSTRSGITSTSVGGAGLVSLAVGQTFNYRLSQTTDAETILRFDDSEGPDVKEACSDIASAISSIQAAADSLLVLGELFKAGSCLAVLTARTPAGATFRSDSDQFPVGSGQTVDCTFTVVRAGKVFVCSATEINPSTTGTTIRPPRFQGSVDYDITRVARGPTYASCTARPQIHRCAIADFTINRPARLFEIGFGSTVGIKASGRTNLQGTPTLREINRRAGRERGGDIIRPGDRLKLFTYEPKPINCTERRMSFWRVSYRLEGASAFTTLAPLFGVEGEDMTEQFNAIRLQIPAESRPQFRIEPISGWEIRSGEAAGNLVILDGTMAWQPAIFSGSDVIWYRGRPPAALGPASAYRIDQLEPTERSSISTMGTVTTGVGYPIATTAAVPLVQGSAYNAQATLTVGSAGTVTAAALALTLSGSEYELGSFTLGRGFGRAPMTVTFNDGDYLGLPGYGFAYGGVRAVGHGQRNGTICRFSTPGTLPAAVPGDQFVFMVEAEADSFGVSLTAGGAPILISDSGSGVISCEFFGQLITVTADPSTNKILATGHNQTAGAICQFAVDAGGTLMDPLVDGANYFLVNPTADDLQVSLTLGGAPIDLTTAGTGTIRMATRPSTLFTGSITALAPTDLGLQFTDGDAMVDAYGRLAETFVYPEIRSSAESQPETRITYANIFNQNAVAPVFASLAKLGVSIRSALEFQQLGAFSIYILGGYIGSRFLEGTDGPSHLLPDAFRILALSPEFGAGQEVSAEQINNTLCASASQWCFERRYFFDANLEQPENLRAWAGEIAPAFLLTFGEVDGQFFFRPAITFEPVEIKDWFHPGLNMKKGTFKQTTFTEDETLPIRMSGIWRDERANTNLLTPGMFAVERQVSIRAANGSINDELVPLELQKFCTNRLHLLDAMKYLIRYREYVDHSISFETLYSALLKQIWPEDYIKVAPDFAFAPGFNTGCVLADGTLFSEQPLTDGTYTVIAWDGGNLIAQPDIRSLVVTDGGTRATPVGVLWSVEPPNETSTYRVMRVTPTQDGRLTIDAVHMPTDEDGRLLMSLGWDDPDNWVIEG